jgi:restriction endonuclease S subunit
VIRIKPDPSVATSEFIVAYLNSGVGRHRIGEITVQATRARIGLGDLKKMHITVPPIEVQRRITERVRMLSVLKEHHRAALRRHDALFTALQHQAFRSEL